VIARDFVWQNAWKHKIKEQENEILGIASQVIETDGTLVLEVSIKGATVPVEFLVVPVTNIYAILGIEFIKAYDVELKFKGNDSYMKWRPSKKDKLRQVPLLMNTQATHVGIGKKINLIKTKAAFQKTLEEGRTRLAYPLPGRELLVRTDASDAGIGAALLQRTPEGDELPILYAHRVFHGAEPYYTTTEKEGLAVLEAIKKWFPQIFGVKNLKSIQTMRHY